MLLAAAGQPAPYTYDSSASRKINNNNNNNNNSSSSNNNNNVNAGTSTPTQTIGAAGTLAARPTTASSIASNAACALMKTLSVRLHRGTEFIKDTVQKALVMNASTPVLAPPAIEGGSSHSHSHSLKRKLIGAGGIMSSVTVSSSGSGSGSGTTSSSSASSSSSSNRQLVLSQPYVAPTAAYLRQFTVAPSMLHRSATARKRNASTDSLLMDLCLFKPIRPMPITPIKINKARGFELKRPKFMPPAANVYSDADDDDTDDEEYEEEPAHKDQEQPLKPKLSTLTLPQHATASAFVPHEPTQPQGHTKDSSNTLTSGTGSVEVTVTGTATATAKPKAAAAKRRRRAPLLTAKRRRKTGSAAAAAAGTTSATKATGTATAASVTAAAAAPKRKQRTAARVNSISPMRHSPPMTRQRARLQISNSSN
ncbi:ras guanine nucleotide exchange factor glfB [Drosophila virilis]|uniref:Uncharacterized protein n=1 Tax=Drosophila virilis TaxID=7244 RepID=B4M538_DROVI|nr:putative mediator of RNA polymerase II transcription subunit 26 [Drosophila virilis]EDW59749.1 uncharacterized protein Dvir_GJ10112 [Drosophila virilis]